MGQITRRPQGADLSPLDARLDALEGPGHGSRTDLAGYWQDYTVTLEQHVWTRLQVDGVDLPTLRVPDLPAPRPGYRWEAQMEGFLRLAVTKPGTIYVGIQTATQGMGGVSGGFPFAVAGEALVPIMQRLPVAGGESIYFSLYALASGGDTVGIIPNPYPYLLVREVVA